MAVLFQGYDSSIVLYANLALIRHQTDSILGCEYGVSKVENGRRGQRI